MTVSFQFGVLSTLFCFATGSLAWTFFLVGPLRAFCRILENPIKMLGESTVLEGAFDWQGSAIERQPPVAMAYCKTRKVDQALAKLRDRLDWPRVTLICGVCHRELLFEVEVTAMPVAPTSAPTKQRAEVCEHLAR